jgi:hypothetical protein
MKGAFIMLDLDTFVTHLYVITDDFCKQHLTPEGPPVGHRPSLDRSEVVTLALLGQWQRFAGERAFYRWVTGHLGDAFPRLPHRSQFNRLVRQHRDAITRFALYLAEQVERAQVSPSAYEILDCTGAATRNAKRRGRGWLAGLSDIGWCTRLGWYHGFHLLSVVAPCGVITGFGFGPASVNDRALAETLFALRQWPHDRLPSAGQARSNDYLADSGFAGTACVSCWYQQYGARVHCSPQPGSKQRWSKPARRWLAGLRQLVETIHDRLLATFGLEHERPHDLTGFQARLAAKVALHNFCVWLNTHLGRPRLAFADLIDW